MGEEREGLEGYYTRSLLFSAVSHEQFPFLWIRSYRYKFPGSVLGAVALFDELFCSLCIAILNPKNVDSEHVLEIFLGQVQQGFDLCYTRVGNPVALSAPTQSLILREPICRVCIHRIQVTQLLDTRLDHICNLLPLPNVRNCHAGLSSHALDFFCYFLAAFFVCGDVVHANIVAVFGQA